MDNSHQVKQVKVQLKHGQRNEKRGQCEHLIRENSLSDMSLMENVKNYINNGIVLLDIEEIDLQNITSRVVEQMTSDGLLQQFDNKNVSNVFILMQRSSLEESSDKPMKGSKAVDVSLKDAQIIDIEKLINNDDSINLQSEPNHLLTETSIVMVGNADFIPKPTISFVRLRTPVHFPETKDYEHPVRFLLVLLGPRQESPNYLEIGSSICTVIRDEEFRVEAYNIKTKNDLIKTIENIYVKVNRQAVVSKQEDHECSHLLNGRTFNKQYSSLNPLLKTNRLWGGLINDVTRRLPQYKSDICDGLNRQVIAASIFLYFGVLSTAITFGGLMSNKTNNLMGIAETLLSTSLVGIVFHLLSSQPLIIVGGTGPLLLFDEALFQLCQFYDFDFLTIRIYIGIWLGLIALAIAAFDGCVCLRLLTRFTQELFASLISLIFMMEAVFKVLEVFKKHPISVANNDTVASSPEIIFHESDDVMNELSKSTHQESNTALFCAILSVGTFVLVSQH